MTSDSKPEIVSLSNQDQHALPPVSELLHLLTMKTNADVLSNIIKYDLLVTYRILQHQTPVENKSRDWMEMLQSGRVEEAVKEAFGNSKDQTSNISQRILLRMIATWR
jgi:c-di-GMP-related signal transduction protein